MPPGTQDRTALDAPVATPQPPAAVDNLDVSALAAMFSRPSPKSEQEGAASSAENPDTAASQPDTEPADAQREPTEAADPGEVTPPAQSPENPEAPEATQTDEAARQAVRATREFETPKFQKRVDELTAKVHALEARLATAVPVTTPQATDQQAPATADTPQLPPVAFHDETLASYDQRIAAARQMIAVAAANPDGMSREEADGKVVEFSADQLRRMAAAATADLAALSAQREVRASQLTAVRESRLKQDLETARATYPWIGDPSSPRYREAMELVRQNPGLMARDDVVWLVAGAVEAQAARAAGATQKAAKAPTGKPTPVATKPAGAPVKASSFDRELAEAEQRAERTGSTADFQRVLALKARMRQQAVRGR